MNPFRFAGPVSPSEVINRTSELEQMLSTAESANATRLVAPREYGKTSLLRRTLFEAESQGWVTVYVDFFGVITLADVANRIELAYAAQLKGDLAQWFAGVRRRFPRLRIAGPPPAPVSTEVDLRPDAEEPLLKRLEMPRRILERTGLRTLVCFDEFQAVMTAREDADEVIRAAIQHHTDEASYVFAGSEVGLMRELFASRHRAFYRQARSIDLTPLDPEDLASYVVSRFDRTGRSVEPEALDSLLEVSAGHPRAAMLLAHLLWERTDSGEKASTESFEKAEREALEQAGADLRALWSGFSKIERSLVTAIAKGEAPFSRNRSDGGNRGAGARAALDALINMGEVTVSDGSHRLVDPFFAELLRRNWQP